MTRNDLEELVEAHQTELFRYLRFIGADYALAEDLLQETYLRAFKSVAAPGLDDLNHRRAWLRRIAHNLFVDHCRRRSRSPVSFSSEEAETAEVFWKSNFYRYNEGFGCMEALEECMKKLSTSQRELIDAFYAARKSRDEIASSLGISSSGVKAALRRIRTALGECIQHRLSEA
ncbi:RNA polymerase sigma factor [Haloferula chungangensis]|uniref:RNA polymerase sigma factor n=1 Tax=Haloferula chungangensis TaxID=1048331 RepID=A0ABW2L0V1_9BACT